MLDTIKNVTKDVTTERDGLSFDPARILWIIGTLVFLGLVIFKTYKNPESFDLINFGLSFAGLLAGGSASIKIKESTEQPMLNGVQQETTIRGKM